MRLKALDLLDGRKLTFGRHVGEQFLWTHLCTVGPAPDWQAPQRSL